MTCLAPRRKSFLCHPILLGPIDANRALVLKFLSPIFDDLKLIVPRIVVLEKLKHQICAIRSIAMVSAALGTLTWAPANGPHRAHSVEFRRAFAIGVKDAETRPAMAGVVIDIDFFDGYQAAALSRIPQILLRQSAETKLTRQKQNNTLLTHRN